VINEQSIRALREAQRQYYKDNDDVENIING